ncbi:hypothetical protein [Streptomyces hygroscopicus]|uniref:hypothetical protein n=1 Tax=Streptomyces hygroscopicus TaxID=1912 RepID=UPI003F1CF34B
MRNDANTYKQNAEEAAKEAEKAAKGNTEAEAIAEKAKNASDEVLKLYPNAFELANKYVEKMKKLRTKAQELDDKS